MQNFNPFEFLRWIFEIWSEIDFLFRIAQFYFSEYIVIYLTKENVGLVSGALVVTSAIPYIWRTFQGKIRPNITSWILWTMIGLSLLLTYKSSGAEDNIWPAVFSFTNPALITIIALFRKGERTWPSILEWLCVVVCISSLWFWFKVQGDKELAQYALYTAIVADLFASIPTIALVIRNPDHDRPFAWGLYSFAYALAIFAVPEYTFANCVLPAYVFLCGGFISLKLAQFRVKEKMPFREWF